MIPRIEKIRTLLENAFSPTHLEVIDDSAKHIGHAGAMDGAGHYTVIISAECFKHLSKIASHRKVYEALDELIPKEIHALQIRII